METLINTIILTAIVVGSLEVYRAHKNHAKLEDQTKSDFQLLKAEVQTLKDKLSK